jgi:hypothetical protein
LTNLFAFLTILILFCGCSRPLLIDDYLVVSNSDRSLLIKHAGSENPMQAYPRSITVQQKLYKFTRGNYSGEAFQFDKVMNTYSGEVIFDSTTFIPFIEVEKVYEDNNIASFLAIKEYGKVEKIYYIVHEKKTRKNSLNEINLVEVALLGKKEVLEVDISGVSGDGQYVTINLYGVPYFPIIVRRHTYLYDTQKKIGKRIDWSKEGYHFVERLK